MIKLIFLKNFILVEINDIIKILTFFFFLLKLVGGLAKIELKIKILIFISVGVQLNTIENW